MKTHGHFYIAVCFNNFLQVKARDERMSMQKRLDKLEAEKRLDKLEAEKHLDKFEAEATAKGSNAHVVERGKSELIELQCLCVIYNKYLLQGFEMIQME